MVRVIEQQRWDADRIAYISPTAPQERARSGTLDAIEELEDPHTHADEPVESTDAVRRVKIMPSDLAKYGTSDRCPKCAMYRVNDKERARMHSHTEACRARIYRALRADGSLKIRMADSSRTQTHERPRASPSSSSTTAPRAFASRDLPATTDAQPSAPRTPPSTPGADPNLDDAATVFGPDDSTEFRKEVNDDVDQLPNAQDLLHPNQQPDE